MGCSACQLDSGGGFDPVAAAYVRGKAGMRSRRESPVDLPVNPADEDKAAAVAYVAAKAGGLQLSKQVDAATPLQADPKAPASGAPNATPATPSNNPPPAQPQGLVLIAMRGDPWEDPVLWLAGATALIAAVNLALHLARRA